ncbi:MAG: quinol dehydrogenase ferredoxin subunit NapH [Alphaproteobacteria bacterium]|nr:quinol dehydrogenase ferredoxin subunit NapH [Alphaproteobacteria bacterium]
MNAPVQYDAPRRGFLARNKWLILRRASQLGFLALFLAGPVVGVWIVKGTLASSLTLGVLPLTDPYMLLQSLFAGNIPAATALIGAAIVLATYAVVGGRVYCSWVCPINIVTDASHWLSARIDIPKGWQPKRSLRYWILGMTLATSAATGVIVWELVNPITLLHRGLLYGVGFAWAAVLAVFLFDLFVSRRGWCGHICPVGAFYGLVGHFALLRVNASARADCDDCMDCYAVCPEPHVITPALKGAKGGAGPVILSSDCSNCGRCIDVCDRIVFKFSTRFAQTADEASLPQRKAA